MQGSYGYQDIYEYKNDKKLRTIMIKNNLYNEVDEGWKLKMTEYLTVE